MKNPRIPMLAASLIGVAQLSAGAATEFQYEPGKIPVLVMQSEVTVDGEERPALGRSFTDTLAGGLLRSGGFSVIDYLSSETIAAEIGKTPVGRPPELDAGAFGKSTGAHVVFVPRMIVEDDFHKMTIKKIRVSDGAVLAVYETEGTGARSTMFGLAEELVAQINGEVARERAERSSAERRLRRAGEVAVEEIETDGATVSPTTETTETTETTAAESSVATTGPPEAAAEPPTAAPRANGGDAGVPNTVAMAARKPELAPMRKQPDNGAELAATIASVNRDYAFCILNVQRGADLAVDDHVRVLVDDPLVPVAKLRITKIEGRQVVAERVSGAGVDKLRPGQRAYRWVADKPDDR